MALIDHHDIDELKNRNEEKVWESIEQHLGKNPSLCRCRDCILDAAAIALNRLPPRYQVYSFHENVPDSVREDDARQQSAVNEAVAQAFTMVAKRPHHF
jgi:competence protein ComFB